jgi:hypothetical protein
MYISINPTLNKYLKSLSIADPQKRKMAISSKSAYGWEMLEYEWGDETVFDNILCPTIFKSDHKVNADAILTNGFMIDIDDPQIIPAIDVIDLIRQQDLACAFIGTANHMRDKDGVTCERYRIYLPFDQPYEIDKHHKEKTKLWIANNPAFCNLKIDHDCTGIHRYFFVGSMTAVKLGNFISYKDICAIQLPKKIVSAAPIISSNGQIPKEIMDKINQLQPHNRSNLTCSIAGSLKHYSQSVKDLALQECIQRGIDKSAIDSFMKYSAGEDRTTNQSPLEQLLKYQAQAKREAKVKRGTN